MAKITCVDHYGKQHTFDASEYIERSAAYGVLLQNQQLLLVKDPWGKKWGLPGGGIDARETPEEALIREFQEETGLQISDKMKKLFFATSYFLAEDQTHPWKTLRTIYTVTLVGGTLRTEGNGTDVLEAKYFSLNAIPINELQLGTLPIIKKVV